MRDRVAIVSAFVFVAMLAIGFVPGHALADGALLVGNLTTPAPRAGNGILRYNAGSGAFVDAFAAEGTGPTGNPLVGPCCLAFGPDGNLYVGDVGALAQGGRAIRRYDGRTGAFIDVFVRSGSGGLGAEDPQLFVFGPDGNLYVASSSTHRVLRFAGATGEFIDDFVPTGSGGLNAPSGLTFGPDGNLYVGSSGTDRVLRYDGTTGAFIDEFVSAGTGGLSAPVGLAFGPDGNLYVASATNTGTGSVLSYDGQTGAFLDAFVPTGSGGMSGPRALLFKPKITICHRPPGNPDKSKTLSIGQLSAGEHIAHGDAVGACEIGSSR